MANEDEIRNQPTGQPPEAGEVEGSGWHAQAPAGAGTGGGEGPSRPDPAPQATGTGWSGSAPERSGEPEGAPRPSGSRPEETERAARAGGPWSAQPASPVPPPGPWSAAPGGSWPPPGAGWHPAGSQVPGQPAPAGGHPGEAGQPGQWGQGAPWGSQWGGGAWGPGPQPGYGQGGGGWGGYGPGGPAYGYGPGGYDQEPGNRRRRRAGAVVALLTAGALIVGGAGVGIGLGIGGGASQPAAVAPSSGTSGGGVSGTSGSSGFGSSGFGSSSGSSSSGGSSVSTSAGSPADVTAIAKSVDPGLVDINTQLAYQSEEAAGTGMVLTSSGEVLTNNHVIEGETAISVTDLGNGRTYRAKVVGYDHTDDVAVLQLEHASGLSTVKLGSSSGLRVGEPIVGIGNAGGVGGTPSVAGGSITALGQSIEASDSGTGTVEHLHDMVETNADIRPGDSGGPLVNSQGQVIGMDTAASTDGSFTFDTPSTSATQGFSIPIDRALRIAKQIEAGHSSSTVHVGATPFLGVEVTTPADLYSGGASSFGGFGGFGGTSGTPTSPPTSSGAAIVEVIPGTAAASSGLAQYDIITSIDGRSVTSPAGLTQQMLGTRVGEKVTFGYVTSSGAHGNATVTLQAGPPQ